jgi:hypothetical protein
MPTQCVEVNTDDTFYFIVLFLSRSQSMLQCMEVTQCPYVSLTPIEGIQISKTMDRGLFLFYFDARTFKKKYQCRPPDLCWRPNVAPR